MSDLVMTFLGVTGLGMTWVGIWMTHRHGKESKELLREIYIRICRNPNTPPGE